MPEVRLSDKEEVTKFSQRSVWVAGERHQDERGSFLNKWYMSKMTDIKIYHESVGS